MKIKSWVRSHVPTTLSSTLRLEVLRNGGAPLALPFLEKSERIVDRHQEERDISVLFSVNDTNTNWKISSHKSREDIFLSRLRESGKCDVTVKLRGDDAGEDMGHETKRDDGRWRRWFVLSRAQVDFVVLTTCEYNVLEIHGSPLLNSNKAWERGSKHQKRKWWQSTWIVSYSSSLLSPLFSR